MNRRIFLLLLTAICTLITAAHSHAATITVDWDGSADYTNIQSCFS